MDWKRWLNRNRTDPTVETVYLNRHERRARGMKEPIGLLPEGLIAPVETVVPRYALRHARAYFAPGRTRRQRKVRARTRRIMAALGMPYHRAKRSV